MKNRTLKDQAAEGSPFQAGGAGAQVVVYLVWIVWFVGLYYFVGFAGIGMWLLAVGCSCFIGWLFGWMDRNVL